MKAITTKYHGPTNRRGSRVTASCGPRSITLSWDDALDSDGNHDKAALALCERMGWTTHPLMGGVIEDKAGRAICHVYTFDSHANRVPVIALPESEQPR